MPFHSTNARQRTLVTTRQRTNAFYISGEEGSPFFIFIGDEPHMNVEQYSEVFLDAVEALDVQRVAIVAGVNGPMPYDKDREISCVYSLPGMRDEMESYAVRLSNYEGGATIGVYLADRAEARGIEVVTLYAMVPAYDFSQASTTVQRVSAEEDYKAWYDLMRRLDYMFGLDLDLSDLEDQSAELITAWESRIAELKRKMPGVVGPYMERVNEDFSEESFDPDSAVVRSEQRQKESSVNGQGLPSGSPDLKYQTYQSQTGGRENTTR